MTKFKVGDPVEMNSALIKTLKRDLNEPKGRHERGIDDYIEKYLRQTAGIGTVINITYTSLSDPRFTTYEIFWYGSEVSTKETEKELQEATDEQ